MANQKRVAAIHDISGYGRCSLTVALPIISAAGIETSVMPTAVLSTHTGGFKDFTYRDLTEDLHPFIKHWQSLDLSFDALYSGFLGSFEQLEIVSEFFEIFKTRNNIVMVDPVMADNGSLYSIFTPEFVPGMAKLCNKADIIVPNLTEASLLVGQEYKEGPYTKEYIQSMLLKLAELGPKQVVLTGVYFDDHELGAACYDRDSGVIDYLMAKKINANFHGTGDVFASALLSAMLRGFNLADSAEIAVKFTANSIKNTALSNKPFNLGVDFESEIPFLLKLLKIL